VECPGCHTTIIKGWKNCASCGVRLPDPIECQQCSQVLDPQWKACPICGTTVKTRGITQGINIQDGVAKDIYQGNNIFITDKFKKKKPELEYEERVLSIIQSGGNLNVVRTELETLRKQLELTLGEAQNIENTCKNMSTLTSLQIPKSVEESANPSKIYTPKIKPQSDIKRSNGNEYSSNFSLDDAYEFLRSKNLDSVAKEIQISRDQFKSYTSTLRRAKVTRVLNNKGLLNEFIEKYWPSGKTKKGQARTQFWLDLYDRFKSSEGQDEQENTEVEVI